MSWKASAYIKALAVCPNGEPISRSEKFVALILADSHQDKAGHFTFPSVKTIAEDALMDERVCRRLLSALERKGVIVRERNENQGRGQVTFYRFPEIDGKGGRDVLLSRHGKGDMVSPFPAAKRRTEGGLKGDKTALAYKEEQEQEQKQKQVPPSPQLAPGEVCSQLDELSLEFTPEQHEHLARCRDRGDDAAKWERYYREENAKHAELVALDAKVRREFPDCERAAGEVMKRCGFVLGDRPDRNPLPKVLKQVLASQEMLGAPPWVTGPRMITAWHKRKSQSRVEWGPVNFFRNAIWLSVVAESEGAR